MNTEHNPDNVGEGWRKLFNYEEIKEGDEYYSFASSGWLPAKNRKTTPGQSSMGLTYRRRIEPAATEPTTEQKRPFAYAIFGINGSGKHYIDDIRVPTDDEWASDDGALGDRWAGNQALFIKDPTTEQSIAAKDAEIARLKAELEAFKRTCGGLTAEQRFNELMRVREELLKAEWHRYGLAMTEDYARLIVKDLIETKAENATLRAELDAAKADSAMMDWQPIETAKKDRVAILVWCPEVKCSFAAYWREWSSEDGGPGWYIFGGYGYALPSTPTHWMPLPKAPAIADAMKGDK